MLEKSNEHQGEINADVQNRVKNLEFKFNQYEDLLSPLGAKQMRQMMETPAREIDRKWKQYYSERTAATPTVASVIGAGCISEAEEEVGEDDSFVAENISRVLFDRTPSA